MCSTSRRCSTFGLPKPRQWTRGHCSSSSRNRNLLSQENMSPTGYPHPQDARLISPHPENLTTITLLQNGLICPVSGVHSRATPAPRLANTGSRKRRHGSRHLPPILIILCQVIPAFDEDFNITWVLLKGRSGFAVLGRAQGV
jgi:hypothetical protein